MRKILLTLCLALMLPGYAFSASDIIATYKYQNGSTLTLCVRDAEHVRMDTAPDSYMLLSGGKIYTVYNDEGQLRVMDMEKAMGKSSGFMSLFGGGKETPESTVQYTKKGRTEKVAGYKGTVYDVTISEGDKVVQQAEVVMSRHSDLKRVNEGWAAIASRMGQMMGKEMARSMEQCAAEAKTSGYGGILRYGDEMRLDSLKKKSLRAAYFKLPSGAQQMQIQSPPQQQATGGMGDELNQDAKDVGRAAKDEAKDSVVDGVREGVRGLFKGMFKN